MADTNPSAGVPTGEIAQKALVGMSDLDWRWLSAAARDLCLGDVIDPQDLMAEAMARYVSGERAWNCDVPLRTQVRNTMRSILCSWRKTRKLFPESSLDDLLGRLDLDTEDLGLPVSMDGEREASVEKLLAIVNAAFSEDPEARDLLIDMASGLDASDIQECLGLTKTQYETVRTRIRRKLAKLRLSGELP